MTIDLFTGQTPAADSSHPKPEPCVARWRPVARLALLCACLCCPARGASGGLIPDIVDESGLLHFASETRLQQDWATGEIRNYGAVFARSTERIEGLLEQLSGGAQLGGGECGAAVPLPDTDDDQAGAGDVRIRSIGSDFSAIGIVDSISSGWSGTFDAPAQLVRITVSRLFQDRQHRLTEDGSFLLVVPGGSIQVGNRSICVERGRWPELALGARVLVSGFWQFLDAGLIAPLDLVAIQDGQLLLDSALRGGPQNPVRMTEGELREWWQARKAPK